MYIDSIDQAFDKSLALRVKPGLAWIVFENGSIF